MFIPKEFEKWKEAVPKDSEFVDEKIVNILCGFVVTRTTIISGE